MNRLIHIQSHDDVCVVIDTQGLSNEKLLEKYGDEFCKVEAIIDLPEGSMAAWPTDRPLVGRDQW